MGRGRGRGVGAEAARPETVRVARSQDLPARDWLASRRPTQLGTRGSRSRRALALVATASRSRAALYSRLTPYNHLPWYYRFM